ncbi:unnamed protein product [Amaranthus hypochondriacus]
MASYFFPLQYYYPFMITFFILVAISVSNDDKSNNIYSACSFNYSCGDIQNVGYPFSGGNRSELCGMSDFKLSCQQNIDSRYYTKMYQNLKDEGITVLDINMYNHTILFNLTNKFKRCPCRPSQDLVTFPSSLKPNAGYKNISLFYGCTNCPRVSHTFFNCSYKNNTNETFYYFDDLSATGKPCSCTNNVTFPVDSRWFHELKKIKNDSIESILPDASITMEYVDISRACSKCEKSGGRCVGGPVDQLLCYCQDGQHSGVCPPKSGKKRVAIGIGCGGIFVLVAILAICCCKKLNFGLSKSITQRASNDISASELKKESNLIGIHLFAYSDLVAATHNFDQSNVLGNGGFGIVYYGKLKDGREVAVKRLFEKSYRRVQQFMTEVKILTDLRHQNLVSLYGCTSQNSVELILVYEYVKNGTVADHLFGKFSKSGLLPWSVRFKIAIETATALSYLHASEIVHRDVKTNNILLDSNFSVKVADFGLSRLFPTHVTHVSTAPQGTPGYLDPEYHLCYKLTDKSDVYSFGVVLIELISSMPAINMDREKLEINLSNFAMSRIQRCAFDELVDPKLGFASDFKVRRMTISVAELAFQCLQHDKEFRPSMNEVLENLKRIEDVDYEALQEEEMGKNGGVEMVKRHRNKARPSFPTEDDQAQLLSNDQLFLPSPVSVMDKYLSISTASNCSK